MERNLLPTIIQSKEFFPKKQRLLCDYILEHALLASTLTVVELAKQANVAPTTVLRLVERLGYNSYNSFKRTLFEEASYENKDTYFLLQNTFTKPQTAHGNSTIASVCYDTVKSCEQIQSPENVEEFARAVDYILNAHHIYVIGLRSAAAVSMYFQNSIRLFMDNSTLLSTKQEYLFDYSLKMTPDDVIVMISTWPCTKKVIDFAFLCHDRHIPIVLITNTVTNPVSHIAKYTINTDAVSTPSEHIASLIVVQAFIEELGRKSAPHSTQKLKELNEFLQNQDIVNWDL